MFSLLQAGNKVLSGSPLNLAGVFFLLEWFGVKWLNKPKGTKSRVERSEKQPVHKEALKDFQKAENLNVATGRVVQNIFRVLHYKNSH